MAAPTTVIKNADGTYSTGGVTVREDNGQLQRKWLWGWQKEDNPQIISNWNTYKSTITPEPETPTTTSSNAPTRAAYSDGAMQARGFKKNAAGNWEKDGVEYDNNGQPIKKTVVVTRPSAQAQGLFSGDLRSYQNRKNWVAEHKDYLKEKGANINWDNYSGTAEQNIALKRLLGGFDEWNAAKQKAAAPAMSPAEKFVKDGYASGRPWQDAELQNMEGSSALYLNQDDYLRWQGLQFGLRQARPYEAPAEPVKPVLNPNAPRKDIYNSSTAVAPRAQVNPIVAAPNYGTEVGSGPTNPNPRADFIENTYTQMKPSGVQAGSASTQARPKTVQEARLQKAQSLTQSSSPIDNALGRMYLAGNKAKHKIGGKINYQKIFK